MNEMLWNLLHDGSIVGIEGAVPGDVSLHVAIEYLRDRFPGSGSGFVVHLSGCTQLSYQPYDEAVITDLAAIAALEPEILGAETTDPLEVACAMGTLILRYESVTLSLDTGGGVSLDTLDAAAQSYWEEFDARPQASPDGPCKP